VGKKLPADKKRVVLHCLVLPSTLDLINQFVAEDGSQGLAVDRALQLRAAGESFGLEHVKLAEPCFPPNATVVRRARKPLTKPGGKLI
jgi:hypothetical protein